MLAKASAASFRMACSRVNASGSATLEARSAIQAARAVSKVRSASLIGANSLTTYDAPPEPYVTTSPGPRHSGAGAFFV